MQSNLPHAPVHWLEIQPHFNDLVVATYGRGFWIVDDITPLQQLTNDVLASDEHLFEPKNAVLWRVDTRLARGATGVKHFYGRNLEAGTAIHYYLREPARGPVRITVSDVVTGEVFRDLEGTGEAGMNRVQWDLHGNQPPSSPVGPGRNRPPPPPLAGAGSYRIKLSVNGREHSRVVVVEEDLWMNER